MSHDDLHLPRASFPIRPGLTLWLGFTLLAWELSQLGAYLSGLIGWLELWLKVMPAQFMLCVCIHDAVHGVIAKRRWMNKAAGVALAMGVLLPFPLLERAHKKHHKALYHEDDPERVVYHTPARWLLFKLPTIPWHYLQSWRLLDTSERALTATVMLTLGVAAAILGGRFGIEALLMGWIAPSLLTIGWFGLMTVYVPHSRHSDTLMRYFTEHSGWHHDHHRSPQYPFNQYLELRHFHLRHHVFAPRGPEAKIVRWLARHIAIKRRGDA